MASLRQLATEHAALVSATASTGKLEATISELKESHQSKIAAIREASESLMEKSRAASATQAADAQRSSNLNIERTRLEWEAHAAELTRRHSDEIGRLKGQVDAAEGVS